MRLVTADKGFKVLEAPDVVMCDWDLEGTPRTHHDGYPQQNTIAAREEVLDVLNRRADSFLGAGWGVRLYWTLGGVRGFCTHAVYDLRNDAERLRASTALTGLLCDPAYVAMMNKHGNSRCRVSPKPGRAGDYVAAFWCQVGSPAIHPRVLNYLKMHDLLCRENRGDTPLPELFAPKGLAESLLRAAAEEPWEPAHAAALEDLLADADVD